MGHVLEKLVEKKLGPITSCPTRLIVEDCENIHVHFRNTRLEFTKEEFRQYAGHLNVADHAMNMDDKNTYKVLSHVEITPLPHFWPDRLVVEVNPDLFHLHYRNLRIEFTRAEYYEFAQAIWITLEKDRRVGVEVKRVPLERINPWDAGHRQEGTWFVAIPQQDHNDRVKEVMEAIRQCKRIRPIVIDDKFQRLDGFCRYWAHKEMGLKSIECIIDKYAFPGCQPNRPFAISEFEYEAICRGEYY